MPEHVRAYIYRILVVALPLLIAYGVVDEQNAALWLALAGAVLSTGLAAVNTSTKPPDD